MFRWYGGNRASQLAAEAPLQFDDRLTGFSDHFGMGMIADVGYRPERDEVGFDIDSSGLSGASACSLSDCSDSIYISC